MSNNAPLSAEGSLSGVVVEFVPSTALPSISGGIRTVALIGTGKTTKTILNNTVTKSASVDTGYALLAFSTITNTGNTVINGDVDLSPAGSIVPGSWTLHGTTHNGGAMAAAAMAAASSSFTAKQTLGLAGSIISSTLDGQTLTPGAYQFTSGSAHLATSTDGTLSLNGAGTYIIYTASTLTVGAGGNATVALIGTATPSNTNIYWIVGSAATLSGAGTVFYGSIIAAAAISQTGAAGGIYNGGWASTGAAITFASATTVNGAVASSSDTLTPAAFSLPNTITDQNYEMYTLGIDYTLVSGHIDWTLANTPASVTSTVDASSALAVDGLTFILSVNGAAPLTTTFSGSLAQAAIVTALNTILGSHATASASGDFIAIANANPAGPINTLQILGGTANAVLGFTGGQLVRGAERPATGITYTFSYESSKVTADYAPAVYYDLQDLINDYGPIPTNTAKLPALYSLQPTDFTLPLGAQVVFQNSANSGAIIAMQLDPAFSYSTMAGVQDALNKLLAVSNINIVVVLTGDPTTYPAILAHVTNASAPLEGRFRTAIVGMQGSPSVATAIGYATGFAAGHNGRRILLTYPASAAIPGTLGDIQTDGSFIAAAEAGLRINMNYDVAEPLLRKQLQGISSIPANLLRTQKLALRNGGVTVVETVNGVIRVMEDTTTDRSTVDASNYSVTEIIDFVSESTELTLNNLFIGIKLLLDTPSMIVTTLNLLLSTFVDLQIINSFKNVSATVNTLDPSQIDVAFDIAPVYPLRYISVKFSI